MNAARLQLIIRTILGVLAAGSVPALEVAGYQDGATTTVGVDGGTVRYLVGGVIALIAVFYPQITTIWASITNNPRLDALEKRVADLEKPDQSAKPAVPTPAKSVKPEA
jgi:hypothetical protein